MDKVFIRGLRLEAVIGVHDWERRLLRPLVFDLELGLDTRPAAGSDQVSDAVDYAEVAAAVRAVTQELQPRLLETLAEVLARRLFEQFPIHTLRLAIDKPGAIANVRGVGVEIQRKREDLAA